MPNDDAAPPMPGESPTSPATRHAGQQVLLVDDNPTNLLVAKILLERLGLEVISAQNGAQALRLFETQSFALVLMDLQMPVLNGYEATRAMRALEANKQGRRTPILALSAAAQSQDIADSKACGMDDHIGKPIHPDVLRNKVLAALDAASEVSRGTIAPKAPLAVSADLESSHPARAAVLDLDAALASLGNDQALLAAVLPSFYEAFQNLPGALLQALDRQDFEQAAGLIHQVKGLAPNIGASVLFDLASRFNRDLHAKDTSLQAAFNQEMRQVLQAIQNWKTQQQRR